MIKIGFIGAGKVGTSLGKYLKLSGFNVIGYYSKTRKSSHLAADFVGSRVYEKTDDLVKVADLVFITVSDDNIEKIAKEISIACGDNIQDKIFCHTSGSLSSEVLSPLREKGGHIAGLHMLLAVSDKYKSHEDYQSAYFTIDALDLKAENALKSIMEKCQNKYTCISPENKARYHAAAVFASNFSVALMHIACKELTECGFSYDGAKEALTPLFKLNAENIVSKGAMAALTGPIQRRDFGTVKKHLECLENSGNTLDVYKVMTNALIEMTGNVPDIDIQNMLKITENNNDKQ